MFKYTTIHSFLSNMECDIIIKFFKENFNLKPGMVDDSSVVDIKMRDSNVVFITFDRFPKIKERLFTKLKDIVKVKGYEIDFENQPLQFTEYKINGHYDWHWDSTKEGPYSNRYCSVVIQLNDEFDGGELLLKEYGVEDIEQNNNIVLDKGKGNLFVFLSATKHKVNPVTSGNRYSLVSWFSLKPIEKFKKTLV